MGKAVLIVLAVLGVLALTCVGGVIVGGGWLFSQYVPPEGIRVSVEMPDQVVVGEEFEIVVTVTNTLDRPREIKDLDFHEGVLDGVRVLEVVPTPTQTDDTLGILTYVMDSPLDAFGTQVITVSAVGETPGFYSGDVDVSVDSLLKIATNTRMLRVADPPED